METPPIVSQDPPIILPNQQGGSAPFSPPPQLEQKPKSMTWIILMIILYAIILYGGAYYFLFYKKQRTTQPSSQTTTLQVTTEIPEHMSQTGSASASFKTVSNSTVLPVYDVPIRDDAVKPTMISSSTITIPFQLSAELIQQCVAYRFNSFVIIGPKGWYADATTDEGGDNIRLYPTYPYAFPDSAIWAYHAKTGSPAAIQTASKFFKWMHQSDDIVHLGISISDITNEYTIKELSTHVASYTVLPNEQLDAIGIIYSDIDQHLADKRWNVYSMTFASKKDSLKQSFMMDVLNAFIEQYNLQ